VEQLAEAEFELVQQLLVDLHLAEQPSYPDHPQLTRTEIESSLPGISRRFEGENTLFAVRGPDGALAGFCWCVLFDPGTGLEGEVAELYVAPGHRGQGMGEALVRAAVTLFERRGVTLGYVWTRGENEAAIRLYRTAGFETNRQTVLTWYPRTPDGAHLESGK
jgi:ribosomal protein S18 acetylase RimI-like enzyme